METAIELLDHGVVASANSLKFDDGISYDEWDGVISKLRTIEGATQWWIGDALRFGEHKYGEMYAQAMDETEAHTWQHYKWVASKCCTRVQLSWTHHREVARLEPDEQKTMLELALKGKWTKEKLHQEVKGYNRAKLLKDQIGKGEMPTDIQVIGGDFRTILKAMPSNSVEMIFTDPPYGEEYIPLYEDLAKLSARVLKPGGSLITYVGHYAIPKITRLMDDYLRYWWILSVRHSGGAARLIGKNVFVEWKPMLWYVKDYRRTDVEWVADMVESDIPTKDEHDWQQGYKEANYYIDKLTLPGELILDPFVGSGTTLISAYKLKRKAIGIEIDENRADVARVHIQTECGLSTPQ